VPLTVNMERHLAHGLYLRAVYNSQNNERFPPLLNDLNGMMMELFDDAVCCINCIVIQAIVVRFPTVSFPEFPSGYRLLFIPGEARGT
jgi:hypothetical protein